MTREEALPIARRVAIRIQEIKRRPDYETKRFPNNYALEGAISMVARHRRCPRIEVEDAVNTIVPDAILFL